MPIKLTWKGWTGRLTGPPIVDGRAGKGKREARCRREDLNLGERGPQS